MKIVSPEFLMQSCPNYQSILMHIELAGRTCYKSEDKISFDSAEPFIRRLLKTGHESVVEHQSITAVVICDRGVSHELVRHRLCSFSQESTRYANYGKEKFGKEITVVKPFFFKEGTPEYDTWEFIMVLAEDAYMELLSRGISPQKARSILPNSLKTEVVITANLREWRHIFKLRSSFNPGAHPQIQEVMDKGLEQMHMWYPIFFEDIYNGAKNK